MKRWGLLLFLATPSFSVAPVITQSTPVVNQGATLQFTETQSEAGTWSCSATNSTGGVTTCSGNITSGGLYTAPSSVTAQHVYGGMQVLPNNDVYNTDISSLPVNSSSTFYMQTVDVGGSPNWDTGFPINYVLPTGSTETINFTYTPANNGVYEIPSFPSAKAESGWFSALQNRPPDHHVIMVDTVSQQMSEFYQYYPNCVTTAASLTSNVATVTCTENPTANEFLVGSTVVVAGFTGADTYFNVASTSITVVSSTSISYPLVHGNGTASTNGYIGKNLSDSTGKINSQSGIKYANESYLLPTNAATDAAGMQLQPLILGLQEVERADILGIDITHASRATFGIGYEASSYTWPATTFAADVSTVPFGIRFRLKSSFDISSYSPTAQKLLKNLQRFGVFNVDGGNEWPMNGETTRWPKKYYDVLSEVSSAGKNFTITNTVLAGNVSTITANNDFIGGQSQVTITGTSNGSGVFNVSNIRVTSATATQFSFALTHANVGSAADSGTAFSALANYMEFIDESSIMVSTFSGLTTENREIVTFTRMSDSAQASVDIALQGPAVNFAKDAIYIMAGTPAQQLTVLNNYGGYTCSMSPSTGTLTSGCLYTPPASLLVATTTIVTASSLINSSAAAITTLTVFPSTGIYAIPSMTSNYTDSLGNTWLARSGVTLVDNQGCCSCTTPALFPQVTDLSLWDCQVGDNSQNANDTHMDYFVPNGTYQIVYHFGTFRTTGSSFLKLSVGNQEILSNFDPNAVAGGQYQLFTSTTTNVTVTNNQLSAAVWTMNNNLGGPISSISAINIGTVPVITSALTASGTVGQSFTYQITASSTPSSFSASPLPGGLSLNSGTGLISGTPTSAGTTNTILSATNGNGTGPSSTLVITIVAAATGPASESWSSAIKVQGGMTFQ